MNKTESPMTSREELHKLIDTLADEQIASVRLYIAPPAVRKSRGKVSQPGSPFLQSHHWRLSSQSRVRSRRICP